MTQVVRNVVAGDPSHSGQFPDADQWFSLVQDPLPLGFVPFHWAPDPLGLARLPRETQTSVCSLSPPEETDSPCLSAALSRSQGRETRSPGQAVGEVVSSILGALSPPHTWSDFGSGGSRRKLSGAEASPSSI